MSTNSHSWTDYYAWWSKSHVIFSSKAYDWANWANNSNISHCCFTVRRYRRKYSTLGHCVCFGCCVMKRKKQNCIGCRGYIHKMMILLCRRKYGATSCWFSYLLTENILSFPDWMKKTAQAHECCHLHSWLNGVHSIVYTQKHTN